MSLVAWNCRGVGSPSTIPDLKYLVRHFNPDLLFLSETLAHRNKIEELHFLLGYDTCFHVDRTRRAGGLALFWKNSLHCQLVNFSNNHITVEIVNTTLGTWRLTSYYGYPSGGRRTTAWNFLRQLAMEFSGPWCIFGDFNDILDAGEKRGRTMRPPWLINGFRRAVIDSGLSDVPVEGYPYTWFKSLGTPRAVEERLDRALANNLWFNMFPNAIVETLVAPVSDHYPILVNVAPITRSYVHKRHFRYENAWQLEPGFKELVTNSWQEHSTSTLMPKLSLCAEDISTWKKNHCHKLRTDIEDCRKQMQDTRLQASGENQTRMFELRKRMQRLLSQDDAYWRQRAKSF
jgi:exonuclease III